ncbi:MAG: MoaD/ThiS family protein [Chloroflexi bacterium]|nr:MoaD/ThiS family protein [Chloroflexota bacterium]
MSVKVYVPSPWRNLTGGKARVEVAANDIAGLLGSMEALYPGFMSHVVDETGEVFHHVNIFVNQELISHSQGLHTTLQDGEEVAFVPALAGGNSAYLGAEKEPASRGRETIDLNALKAGGFIMQRQGNFFSLRLKVPVGNITGEQLMKVADVAQRYGKGHVHLTMRQGIEIPFIRLDDFNAVTGELAIVGLGLGACGARVRVVTACQGTAICPHALGDTHSLAGKLDERLYGRWGLPHKFKMGVTGCPNACAKPQENDLGFMAVVEPVFDESGGHECIACGLCVDLCPGKAIQLVDGKPVIDRGRCFHDARCIMHCPTGSWRARREGWNAYVGGKWGRQPQLGVLFAEFLSEEQAVDLAERTLAAYCRLANKGERLGSLINRLGLATFKGAVYHEQPCP